MRNIRAIIKKEFLHILRDRKTLMIIAMMPLVQLMIYGYAIDTDVKHISTALYDEDKTPMSRRLVDAFEASSYFDINHTVGSEGELRLKLDEGDAKVGLHIPVNFSKDLLAGRGSELQLVIDGTDSSPATIALNTGQAIMSSFLQSERLTPIQISPVDYRPRLWYNPDLKSSFFMVPGLVGLLIQILIPMVTATAIVREKEQGNIEQLLVTPIKRYELIAGKLIPYVVVGLVIAFTIMMAARILFHVPIRGNPLTLFALTLIFITVCLGIGLLASTLADNQQQAAQIVMFLAPPSILLSGFIFPRESMPAPIYYFGFLIPLTYFLKIVRGITLKGIGVAELWHCIVPLFTMAAAMITASILSFHKRLR